MARGPDAPARRTARPALKRRPTTLRILLAALLPLFLFAARLATAEEPYPLPRDEDFIYDIGFLWFGGLAEGWLRIRRISDKKYRADLLAETKGLVGFLTSYRKNHYLSEMDYVPGLRRLVTRRFTKVVSWGSELMESVTELDYGKGVRRWMATENGKVMDEGIEPIPEGVIHEDLLSAFFNLRHGAFGPLTRGRRLKVTSLPYYHATEGGRPDYEKEFVETFEIHIAEAFTERVYRRRFGRTNETGLLVIVEVPRTFFGQKSGEVLVWFDANLIPVAARVENVILFGDVFGNLRGAPRAPISREDPSVGRDGKPEGGPRVAPLGDDHRQPAAGKGERSNGRSRPNGRSMPDSRRIPQRKVLRDRPNLSARGGMP